MSQAEDQAKIDKERTLAATGLSMVDLELARLSLYDLSRQLVELMAFREEPLESDERQAVDHEIARYVAAEIQKVDNIRGYLRQCELMEQGHRTEADRQTKMAQDWEERARVLKQASIRALENVGKTKVEGRTGSLRIQKNGGVQPLEITDEKAIPSEYTPLTITYPLDKDALRRDLAAGKVVPGARLSERGVHLRVE